MEDRMTARLYMRQKSVSHIQERAGQLLLDITNEKIHFVKPIGKKNKQHKHFLNVYIYIYIWTDQVVYKAFKALMNIN